MPTDDARRAVADHELSEAVVAYLQWGSASSPAEDAAAVAAVAQRSSPHALVDRVETMVRESLAVPVDWSALDLAAASRAAAAETARRHPGLTDHAVQALAWNFSFAWR